VLVLPNHQHALKMGTETDLEKSLNLRDELRKCTIFQEEIIKFIPRHFMYYIDTVWVAAGLQRSKTVLYCKFSSIVRKQAGRA